MSKDEFLLRFTLLTQVKPKDSYQHPSQLKPAAVLIALVDQGDDLGLAVLFTKRAAHLRHHPSQVSFPGGKQEPTDVSPIDTALRESFEEIGLSRDVVTIAGQLPPYQTISGFEITPIVAIINGRQDYIIDTNEVAEIFHAPLAHFLAMDDYHILLARKGGKQHKVHFLPYKHYPIWGATAAMVKDLVRHICPSHR